MSHRITNARLGWRARKANAATAAVGKDGKLALLAALPVFARATPKRLVRLGRVTELAYYDVGEELLSQGRACDGWLVVAEGAALVCQDGEPLGVLGPGDWCGEGALSLGQPSDVSVIAMVPVTAVFLSPADFFTLPHRFPEVAAYLLRALSAQSVLAPLYVAAKVRR